jgi:Tfp pilus assembly protein PilF
MLREGRYGLAEGMYMKALQEVPEFPAALADLVRVHLARRDGKEAVRWAERLVAKQDGPLHQLLLGDAQALRGNTGAAQGAWTKAAKGGNKTARQRLAETEEDGDEE